LDESTRLAFEVELDLQLMECVSLDESSSQKFDRKTTTSNVRKLAKVLLVPLEYGSGYYWEIRNVYLNINNGKFSGSATVYLGCTQREDREWQRPTDQPLKRKSEIRTPIPRFNCMGNVTFTIDILRHHVLVEGSHQQAHQHPQHRQVDFPEAAKQWIQDNRQHNLRSKDIYKHLQQDSLINPQIHTKAQVYYWASVFSRETFMLNEKNQLLSAKTYLEEKPEFMDNQVKVLSYLENDFVRTLGFTTSLLHKIGAANVTEIVVDSTWKTNQERFELFVVNANCGGYGMPIAYLYLLTLEGSEAALGKPENAINTRVQALRDFFTSLREKGVLPVFFLTDKDAGQISAAEQAWSWTANIQLCYWHLEHAIKRRLNDKKSRLSTYSTDKASEAHEQFPFIDRSWVPQQRAGSICPDRYTKELLDMIKRHANMHPLIPIAGTFETSTTIYRSCVEETYLFCRSRGLASLWGYLWTCWYNTHNWKLFSRSSYSDAMPLARTTMITEAHWRVLKYDYKYKYSKPRLDQLTQILMEQLVPDYELKMDHHSRNREFPSWWKAFKQEWDRAKNKEMLGDMDERYHIDVDKWICSCHAYLRSPYLVCKHLVLKSDKDLQPTFLETMRRHDYPFVAFGKNISVPILQKNNPWRKPLQHRSSVVGSSSSGTLQQELARLETMESRREELAEWKRVMERGFDLYDREMGNDRFVEQFRNLMKPITKAVRECETSGSKAGKLASWLR
jgi:hypothetical protein